MESNHATISRKGGKGETTGTMSQKLEESGRLIAEFGKRNIELEEELRVRNQEQEQHIDVGAMGSANLR